LFTSTVATTTTVAASDKRHGRPLFSSTIGKNPARNGGESQGGESKDETQRVIYQKVVRPPNDTQQARLDFLPSLIDYIQNDFRVPNDLAMPYSLKAMDDDNDGEDGADGGGYSIVAIDSPLSRDSRMSRMDVEVVGIYPDDEDGGKGGVIPTMVMVVVKERRLAAGGGGADIITSRLFEESKKKILKALENGLDDFMDGRVQSRSRSTAARSVGQNNADNGGVSRVSSPSAGKDIQEMDNQEEEEEWNLDEFEELQDFIDHVDAEDDLLRKVRNGAATNLSPNIELDETGSVVIDAQSTNVIDPPPPPPPPPPKRSTATTAVDYDDFAVKAAKQRKEESAQKAAAARKQSKQETSKPKGDVDFAVQAARAAADQKRKMEQEDDDYSSSSSGNYAIEAAARIAKALKQKQKINNENCNSNNSGHVDEIDSCGCCKDGVPITPSSTSTSIPYQESSTTTDTIVSNSIEKGDAIPMSMDSLPNTIPIGKRDRKGAFQFSISSPARRQQRQQQQEERKGRKGKVVVPDSNVDAMAAVPSSLTSNKKKTTTKQTKMSTTQGTTSTITKDRTTSVPTPKDTGQKKSKPVTSAVPSSTTTTTDNLKKMDINLVRNDDKSIIDPNVSEEERQRSLDNLAFTSKPSSSSSRSKASSIITDNNGSIQQPPPPSLSSPPTTKTDAEIEQDIIKAAVDIMPGFLPDDDNKQTKSSSSQNEEEGSMTPEELLKDVLKFGEDMDKEEEEGAGFVSGAFSKAKELMREEKQNLKMEKEETTRDGTNVGLRYQDDPIGSDGDISLEELELKRIFAAGESIANGRMTASNNNAGSTTDALTTTANNGAIDYEASTQALIDADTTVSRNVRTLDEDLAQLEVRISRTPGEAASDAGSSAGSGSIDPLFDVFSGPETYNPNVDPETSVNWPGAAMGTRTDVKMPPELAAAVKNAKFAADLLSKMAIMGDDNAADDDKQTRYSLNGKEISPKQMQSLQTVVDEGVKVGLIIDPIQYLDERARLSMVVDEMKQQPEERYSEIIQNYNDLVLCDNFVTLIQHRLRDMDSHIQQYRANPHQSDEDVENLQESYEPERNILIALVNYAQYLLKQAQALGSDLEATQLSIIRSICVVAMDPKHTTEEQTACALSDAVRDMRPLLDETFVSYLKYAVAEEEAKLAREGLLDDPDANRWLFVLKIVQQGVYRELEVGIKRYIDHISYVLRMETKEERKQLLTKIIDVMPSMDVRPFVKVVDNIAASLGQSVKGDFDREDAYVLGVMANKILQLRKDVETLLPKERLDYMSRDADEWAMRQKERLLEMRNMTKNRLKAARETDQYEEDDEIPGRFREVERMT